jgi:DNA repair photolyase
MHAIRTAARTSVERVRELIAWPAEPTPDSWRRGFLAGIFDAEGCFSGGCLRISNTDRTIIERVTSGLAAMNFASVLETAKAASPRPVHVVRLRGGMPEMWRFFHAVTPAIRRKCAVEGTAVKSTAKLRVASVEPLGHSMRMFDITTATGDFVANGVVSHNCFARPTHEYFGLSAGLDFETTIFVKTEAPQLLRAELMRPKWDVRPISISGVTDCYQPVERKLRITRRCLQVLLEFRNPCAVITKSHLVTRDVDVLRELAAMDLVGVILSITTLDNELQRRLEPRAASPGRRLAAIEALAKAGVPVGVMTAPVIPGLTDHEVPALLKAAADAGATFAGYTPVRLPFAVAPMFEQWLGQHFPDRKEKVLNRIRSIRGGKLNDSEFGSRMRGEGPMAEQLHAMFTMGKKRAGITGSFPELSREHFRRPLRENEQLALF